MFKLFLLFACFTFIQAFPERSNNFKLREDVHNLNATVSCSECLSYINEYIELKKSGADRETMRKLAAKLCEIFMGFGVEGCKLFSEIEMDVAQYIFENKDVKAEEVCGIFLQDQGCPNPYAKKWEIDIPSKEISAKLPQVENYGGNPLKIVQISDVHYDPLYNAGSNANCDLPLCCEERNGVPASPADAAGDFADYRMCDMSKNSIVELLEQIRKAHEKIDYIYFTGDVIAHRNWETSKKNNLDTIEEFYSLIEQYFPDTTVYPILGNHESHPTNMWAPLNLNSSSDTLTAQWLFDAVAEFWSKWLPASALQTIKLGGYYTVLVKPGFRIVALNSNVCYTPNYWLFFDDEDPYGQLKWLVQVLLEAEQNNERVHILSHVPPGEASCHRQWQYNFNRIVQRFSKIISAQFNGHTHDDEFRIFKDENDSKQVINVAFNGGSYSTFSGLNPDYRIYEVDSGNLMVLDYDQYTFDLALANALGGPDWYKLYSFKAAYGLNFLDYASFNKLNERLQSDSKLAEQYVNYYVRGSQAAFKNKCDGACRQKIICHISAIDADESIKCGAVAPSQFF